MRKTFFGAGLLLLAFAVFGVELPEIVARCGNRTVGREEAARLMRSAPPDLTRLPPRDLLKQVLTDLFCEEAMTRMLTDAGFPPTEERTVRALTEVFQRYPDGMKRPDEGELRRIARERRTCLLWAYLRYLEARRPELFRLPPAMTERYYREHQTDFLLPRRAVAVRYLALDVSALTALQARVRQGEPPERILPTLAGVRAVPVDEADPAVAGMRAGEWSAVGPVPGGYAVLYVSGEKPACYVPLEQAAPLIREKLVLLRAEAELETSLKTILTAEKMEFYF